MKLKKPQLPAPIEFHDVHLSLQGHPLIHNMSCKLTTDGKTVVMGANGAGKSLFLRLIAGLLTPDNGQIIKHAKEENEPCISMVFQSPVLLRRSTYANVAYALKQQAKRLAHSKDSQERLINEALSLAQLQRHKNAPARRLSGGEQQRLALARALVVSPNILLLDEATANLDPASTQIVEKMVDEVSQNGTKIVFVTHDVRQAKRVADDILFIHEGRIMVHKPVKDFFLKPGSIEAQAFLDGNVPDKQLKE